MDKNEQHQAQKPKDITLNTISAGDQDQRLQERLTLSILFSTYALPTPCLLHVYKTRASGELSRFCLNATYFCPQRRRQDFDVLVQPRATKASG